MTKDEIIKEFVIKGFENISPTFEKNGKHDFVLKNRTKNFIKEPENFEYHRWASSLKSSQAFAYNIFSGSKNVKFECHMPVFDRAAQIDVKITDISNQTIHLMEVKMFEIINMGEIKFSGKYDEKAGYKHIKIDKVSAFINFKNEVINCFKSQRIYGSGIKQLCSHLLGILNIMDLKENKDFKFKLYSFCFDKPIFEKFDSDIESYKKATNLFKTHVDKFLKEINVDSRVEYMGFLSATEYIKKNKELIGNENYEYVMKRYFY